jgi:hypothetical protein
MYIGSLETVFRVGISLLYNLYRRASNLVLYNYQPQHLFGKRSKRRRRDLKPSRKKLDTRWLPRYRIQINTLRTENCG